MTSELQQTRYDNLLRRVGGIIGPGSKVAEALAELFPVIEVESVPLELMRLTGWRLGMASDVRVAQAVLNNQGQLFNPADSGKLVVLERVDVQSDTAQHIEYDVGSNALTVDVGNTRARDTRDGIGSILIAQNRHVSQAGTIATIGSLFIEADVMFTLAPPQGICVLAPGTGFVITTTVQNTSMIRTFLWREREAEASEVNF